MNYRLSNLIALMVFSSVLCYGQNPYADYIVTVSDGTGLQSLHLGLDPAATDGIDAAIGESEAPPLPFVGVFDARFVGASLGLGAFIDYRQGGMTTRGSCVHQIQYQVGSGTTITVGWNFSSGVTGRLQDIILGSLIDVPMTGIGSYTVLNPTGFNRLNITLTYSLEVTTASALPDGRSGVSYSQELAARFGPTPYTWTIAGGTLPDGLTLSQAGIISGTPTKDGIFDFNVNATDNVSTVASKAFNVHIEVPLAIQLSSFTARVLSEGMAMLEWTTLSEVNNYGFVIQRRHIGAPGFVDLPEGFIQGHGTSLEVHRYSFVDEHVLAGELEYRLKQIDNDGTSSLSESVRISTTTNIAGSAPIAVGLEQNYPNPFNPMTTIRYGIPHRTGVIVTVFNSLGQQVGELVNEIQDSGYHDVMFDATGLASGVYFYRLQAGSVVESKKLLLLR